MRVIHIGAYPPPYGGVASHVMRLDALCRDSGLSSAIIDGYGDPREAVPTGADIVRLRGSRLRKLTALALRLRRERADVVHFHLSSLSNFLWGAVPVMVATRGSRRIASLHSGSFVHSYTSAPAPVRRYMRAVFGRFDHVLSANVAQRDLLEDHMGLSRDRLSVVSPFLPLVVTPGAGPASLPPSLNGFCESFERLALVTGFMRSYYGLHTAIEAFDLLTDLPVGLVVQTYTSVDEGYRRRIQAMLRQRSNVYVSEFVLPEEQFLGLLSRVDVFIRATSVDGDSVALREAVHLGRQIVATDVVPRPEGCLLFPFDYPRVLADCIRVALDDPTAGRVPDARSHAGEQILAVYRRLMAHEARH